MRIEKRCYAEGVCYVDISRVYLLLSLPRVSLAFLGWLKFLGATG